MKFIDISRDLLTAAVYRGTRYRRWKSCGPSKNGDECNLSALCACVHAARTRTRRCILLKTARTLRRCR
jgi:hypothetical protein